jgi:hypothetical protein
MGKHSISITLCTSMEGAMLVGIDLAKNVFAVHAVNAANAAGKAILVKPDVRRTNC